jgi:eukaryotic-like serine/threonine-protein kinase
MPQAPLAQHPARGVQPGTPHQAPHHLPGALRGSYLLAPRQPPDPGGLPSHPRELAHLLLGRGWLTSWQARVLSRGRARGLRVGPYLLLRRLGRGGMSAVFQARHLRLGRLAAVKVLRRAPPGQDHGARFRAEARAAALADHPNVVRAYDAGRARRRYYLALEYVEGTDLQRLVEREGPLGPAAACAYARQAALGLHHLHERGVVHRDVKPANLLLSRAGVVKVADLGLARLPPPDADPLARPGRALGTADYIPPEQALDGASADARADLYGLGCTLYFLLGGRVPFPGGSAVLKLARHVREEPPPLEGVPPGVAAVVRRLMAKEPGDRFPSASEAAACLGSLLDRDRAGVAG